MNIANKLTILRVLLVPVFIVLLMSGFIPYPVNRYIALAIFIIAALTDFLDGYLARSRNLITTFGKFMDPLADKLLVTSALICFIQLGDIPAWIVIVIVAREFTISGFRLVAASEGIVIAASWWGKIKTVVQMFAVIVILIQSKFVFMQIIENILIYSAIILTIISLIDYIAKNIHVLKDIK